MKRMTLAALAFVAAVILTACGGSDKNYKALVANEWELERIVYADSNYSEEAPNNIFIVFADSNKTMFGHLGCNTVRGGFEINGKDQIEFSKLASTMMWCDKMDFETRYSKLLEMVTTYKASTHELILSDSEGKIAMHYLAKVAPAENKQSLKDAIDHKAEEADSLLDHAGEAIEGAADKAGDKIEDAADKAGDAIKKAVDKTDDVIEKAADKTGEAIEKAADKTGKAVKKAADKTEDAITNTAKEVKKEAKEATK